MGGAYLIISAQGLVFDYQTLSFSRTGGIYLNYTPSESQVEVNGVVHDYSGIIGNLFQSGTFLGNVVPGNYRINISYPGYSPWEKTLNVSPGVVTAASQITLWPKNWGAKKISDYQVVDFWFTGNGLIIKTNKNELYLGDKKIKGTSVLLNSGSRDTVVTGDSKGYYVMNPSNSSSSMTVDLPLSAGIKDWFFHPFDQNAVLAIGQKGIYYVNSTTGLVQKIYSLNGDERAMEKNNEIFVAQDNGDIFSANFLLRTDVTMPTGIVDGIADMETNSDGDIIYLADSKDELFQYDRSNQTTTSVDSFSGQVQKIYPSPDDTRLALLSPEGRLSILAVNDYKMDYPVKRGSSWKIDSPKPASDFIWLPGSSNYGIISSDGNLTISELDERMPQNQYNIVSGASRTMVEGDGLYFIKNGSLFEISLKQK